MLIPPFHSYILSKVVESAYESMHKDLSTGCQHSAGRMVCSAATFYLLKPKLKLSAAEEIQCLNRK